MLQSNEAIISAPLKPPMDSVILDQRYGSPVLEEKAETNADGIRLAYMSSYSFHTYYMFHTAKTTTEGKKDLGNHLPYLTFFVQQKPPNFPNNFTKKKQQKKSTKNQKQLKHLQNKGPHVLHGKLRGGEGHGRLHVFVRDAGHVLHRAVGLPVARLDLRAEELLDVLKGEGSNRHLLKVGNWIENHLVVGKYI